jgi:hypothetical protein
MLTADPRRHNADKPFLPGQNTHAFQADKQMASRVSGTAGFASAGRGGKSLCPSASVE